MNCDPLIYITRLFGRRFREMQLMPPLFRPYWRQAVAIAAVWIAGFISTPMLTPTTLDCLFALRRPISTNDVNFPPNVVIVYLNKSNPGNWQPFAELVRRLAQLRAKIVVFDFVFTSEAWNQPVAPLADAVRAASNRTKVMFASEITEIRTNEVSISQEWLPDGISNLVSQMPQNPMVGLARLEPDPDQVVRRCVYTNLCAREPLPFAVAQLARPPVGRRDFFINYYGPPNWLLHYEAQDLPTGGDRPAADFRDAIVFVGAASSDDLHPGPFAHGAQTAYGGVEVQATACANLIQGSCIRGLGSFGEGFLILFVGGLCGCLFVKWTPKRALVVAIPSAVLVNVLSFLTFKYANCLVPCLAITIQLLTAVASSFIPVQSAFISYRSSDKGTILHMVAGLKRLGLEVFCDIEERPVGYLKDVLLPEIERRRVFVLVLSPEVLTFARPDPGREICDWVAEEIACALSKQKPVLLVYISEFKSMIDEARKAGSLPAYQPIYTKEGFSLATVLSTDSQMLYSVNHYQSSIRQIARMLPFGLRQDWGRRSRLVAYAKRRST